MYFLRLHQLIFFPNFKQFPIMYLKFADVEIVLVGSKNDAQLGLRTSINDVDELIGLD